MTPSPKLLIHTMKNLIWIVPLALIAIVGYSAMGSYNGFVSLDEDVDGQWANVETQYQRRFDLIPNLVATVKGVAEFEQETLTAVTEARASAFNAMQAVGEGTGSIADFQQSNLVLGRAMNGLLGYSERYPELKANQNFSDLQAQLEGTENRIAVAEDFNASVKAYNGKVRRFPGSLWAACSASNNGIASNRWPVPRPLRPSTSDPDVGATSSAIPTGRPSAPPLQMPRTPRAARSSSMWNPGEGRRAGPCRRRLRSTRHAQNRTPQWRPVYLATKTVNSPSSATGASMLWCRMTSGTGSGHSDPRTGCR